MTEEQAKLRWCPFARVSIGLDPEFTVHNRVADAITGKDSRDEEHGINHPEAYNCIASACMAWRWSTSPRSAAEVNARGNAGAVASGYCGLAK